MNLMELPNGMEIALQSRAEVGYFYQEVFVERVYCQHGIELEPGACVFDVGANIGMFSLFVQQAAPGSHVFAFEPCPPLYELARFNVGRYGPGVRLFPFGLSGQPRRSRFTFYPHSSGMSSCYGDPGEERELLRTVFENQARRDRELDRLLPHLDDLLDQRLEARTFEVELRSLSQVLREHRVQRIDLLKVDVQKAEAEVLAGIDAGDWEKVRQIVLEVHDVDDRLGRLRRLLVDKGFDLRVDQDELYVGSNVHLVYARRPQEVAAVARGALRRAGDRARNMRRTFATSRRSTTRGDSK